ncbi:FlgN protein [uncultured Clostridium sp.]|uniref:flagellar protein FlgN n=1 Tax=uncultured Clostridium sp. TaxID=59620 RepID=UPI000820A6A3|nr:flagellar protein FlgN [uncultured Clostridium sp.]SCJ98124.1 FlgN protein [uncultured Clostridium sp.]
MNAELKLIVFEEKNILQELLELLDNQYRAIIDKEIILIEKITTKIESIGKRLATIEIKRRNFVKDGDFKSIIENSEDDHIKSAYAEIKVLLNNLELQKDTNNTLIKQQLFFTNKMIKVIKPSKSVGTYNSYGKISR